MFDSKTELANLCRICLQDCETAIDIFAELEESKEVLKKLNLCFQIIFKFEDYLPSVICNYCLDELNLVNNFREKCITAEDRFLILCKQFSDNATDEDKGQFAENFKDEVIDLFDGNQQFVNADFESDLLKDDGEFCNNIDPSSFEDIKTKIKKLECNICERVFKTNSSLLKHNISRHQNRTHVGKITGYGASRRYHCTKCSYSTPYSQTLVTHVRRHTGEKPYICECGKRFTDLSTYGNHRKIHSNNTFFVCAICGKQFKLAKGLRQHSRCHENGKYACNICHKVLKSRQTLQDHTRRHNNIRNFNCEDCGEMFVTSSELIHHKNKHKTIKNLECSLCGYKTLRKRNLIVHIQRHTNNRPYKCDLCEASFYTRPDVRRHQRIHTRDKAFLCPRCPKGFTRKPALLKHIESTHGAECGWSDNKIKEYLKKLGRKHEKLSSDNISIINSSGSFQLTTSIS